MLTATARRPAPPRDLSSRIYSAAEAAMSAYRKGAQIEAACIAAAQDVGIDSAPVMAEVRRRAGQPRDDDAEEILLGALLRFGAHAQAALALPLDAWYSHGHQLIATRAAQAVAGMGDRAYLEDAVLLDVDARMFRLRELDLVGGQMYLLSLADCVVSCVGLEAYAASVREHWLMRRLFSALQVSGEISRPADLRRLLPGLVRDLLAISSDLEATCA